MTLGDLPEGAPFWYTNDLGQEREGIVIRRRVFKARALVGLLDCNATLFLPLDTPVRRRRLVIREDRRPARSVQHARNPMRDVPLSELQLIPTKAHAGSIR